MTRTCLSRRLLALTLALAAAAPAAAQQAQGCFAGSDAFGQPARMVLTSERYGDFYEIFGTVSSAAIGTMRIKVDGWSGAGRLFRGHEYESGALYVRIGDYTGASLVLEVEGYGAFPFQAAGC